MPPSVSATPSRFALPTPGCATSEIFTTLSIVTLSGVVSVARFQANLLRRVNSRSGCNRSSNSVVSSDVTGPTVTNNTFSNP